MHTYTEIDTYTCTYIQGDRYTHKQLHTYTAHIHTPGCMHT